MPDVRAILNHESVRAALWQAWNDSVPGTSGGHEEGGFIVRDSAGEYQVIRWPKGEQNAIVVPPHLDCKLSGLDIVASFHTHPNTGTDYIQEPSETDRRAVRDDRNLKGLSYQGELVIARANIYLIAQDGSVLLLGETKNMLSA